MNPFIFLNILTLPSLISIFLYLVGIKGPSLLLAILFIYLTSLIKGKIQLKKSLFKALIILTIFLLIILSNYFSSPSVINKIDKFVLILYAILLPISAIFLFSKNKLESFPKEQMVSYSKIFIFIFSILFIFISKKEEGGARYSLPSIDDPIFISRIICYFILLLIYFEEKVVNRKYILVYLLAMSVVLMTGSKGPFLALILCLVIDLLKRGKFHFLKLRHLIMMSVIILFGSSSYLFNTEIFSIIHRLNSFEFVFSSMPTILGNGFGSFELIFMDQDGPGYPHNIFIELLFESGVLGFSSFCLLIGFLMLRVNYDFYYISFLYWLINAQFSGDLPGNNFMVITMYMLIANFYTQRNASQKL